MKNENKRKVIIHWHDYSGNPTTAEVLPKKRIKEIIENLDWYEIVQMAWDNWGQGWDSVVWLDLRNGKLINGQYSPNTQDQDNTSYVEVFRINAFDPDPSFIFDLAFSLSPIKHDKKNNIHYTSEVQLTILQESVYQRKNEIVNSIMEQLDEIYSHSEIR